MTQRFQVLRCYECSVFQVHQLKKVNKFECKLCGEKQSIKRRYGFGTGKECRLHVQKLNGIRGDVDTLQESFSDDENCDDFENVKENMVQDSNNTKKESKWSEYIDKPETETNESATNNMYLEDVEVVLEAPPKRRKFTRNFRNNSKANQYTEENHKKESIEIPIIEYKPSNSNIKSGTPSTGKQGIRKRFIPPTCSKQSKWAQYMDDNDHQSKLEEVVLPANDPFLEANTVTNRSTFNSSNNENSITNTQSKWDFYTNSKQPTKQFQTKPVSISNNLAKAQTTSLFSLCNDNELDNILDI